MSETGFCMIPCKINDDIVKQTNCSIHSIVEDYVDIDLDTSKQIFYCKTCFATFTVVETPLKK